MPFADNRPRPVKQPGGIYSQMHMTTQPPSLHLLTLVDPTFD